MEKKVSIIIPVYNTQKYLKKCINSIIDQTYSNLEIILVNDGSTDNSLEICKEYEKIDERVFIISGENHGVSHARNMGIRKAKGEYLYFADSDDYLETDAIEKMIQGFEKADCELIIAGYNEVESEEKIVKKSWGKSKLKSDDAKKLILDENGVGGYLWNKLFKLSLIKKFEIKFDETIYVWEDVLFVMEYLDKCKYVCLIDDIVYAYCRRAGSAVEYSLYTPQLYTQLNAIEKIATNVYPKLPTDMQAEIMAMVLKAKGKSYISENIFNGRNKHIPEMNKMGANITQIDSRHFEVNGVDNLVGTEVEATDLRGGAGLVIAGLSAEGETTIKNISHIERGYDKFDEKIQAIGGKIYKV